MCMFKGKVVKPSFGLSLILNLPSTLAFPDKRSMRLSALFRSIKMTYATLGTSTSLVEVTNISQHGFWVLLSDEELFLPFSEFPWFRDVAIGKILHVELPSPNLLYWP